MCLDLLKRREPFNNGGLMQPAMGSVKTPLPAEGENRKQRLFAFLLGLRFTSTNVKSVYSHTLIPVMHYLKV